MPIRSYCLPTRRPNYANSYTIRLFIQMRSSTDPNKKFTILDYQCENCMDRNVPCSAINVMCPTQLLEKLFKMMGLCGIVRFNEYPNGQTQITVTTSSYTIDRYISLINQILHRSIFQISANEANIIVKKLRLEHYVYCIEECNGFCLVVLSPSLDSCWYDPDFREGQSWTLFKQEADMLIAKKSAAAATAASATVPESGK